MKAQSQEPIQERFVHFLVAGLLVLPLALSACGADSVIPLDTVCSDELLNTACEDSLGTVCTWAGTGIAGYDGGGNCLRQSDLYWPIDLTFAPDGNIYIMDWNNHAVRRVTSEGRLERVVGTDALGDGPHPTSGYSDLIPPGAPGTSVALNHPSQIVPLPDGKMLLVSWHNHKLRTYDPATGLALVVCGSDAGFGGDGGPAADARLSQCSSVAVTDDGMVYVLDQRNQRIRKIDNSDIINTVVGTGDRGFAGDGGPPLQANLAFDDGGNPQTSGSLVLDSQGRLYISDSLNNRIRRVDFGANLIETIAGNGDAGYNGDGIQATQASLNNPRDLEFGPDGRLYVADELNHRVRAIDLDTGIITTVAGSGIRGYSGDGGPAVDAAFDRPTGLAFDAQGKLYIADYNNHRIRRLNF